MTICSECGGIDDDCLCARGPRTVATPKSAKADSSRAPLTGSEASLRAEIDALKTQIEHWALSLPEHPKWQWLRDEMLAVARTEPPNAAKLSDWR